MKKGTIVAIIILTVLLILILFFVFNFSVKRGSITPVEGTDTTITETYKIKELQRNLYDYSESLKQYNDCLKLATNSLVICYTSNPNNSSCSNQYDVQQQSCELNIKYPPIPDPTSQRYYESDHLVP